MDALASPSWQFPEASFLFWAVLGLGLASLRTEEQAAPLPLPRSLRRAGQYAVSGGLAVLFAAQILPLGLLLSPVEAYTSPAGWLLVSSAVTLVAPTGKIVTGSQLQFQVIATYKNPAGATVTRDVTSDSDTSYSGSITFLAGTYDNSYFPGGLFTVPFTSHTHTNSLSVNCSYTDPGLVGTPNKGKVLCFASPITIQPS